jgi:hypothetical protein
MKMKLVLFFSISVFLMGCRKIEGQGGSSEVVGKVFIQDRNGDDEAVGDPYAAQDVRVYIIYGPDGNVYDDDFRTSFDGSYRFQFLTNGTYRIFAYQECPSCEKIDDPVIQTVEIDSRNQTVVVPDIVLDNY